MYERGSLWRKWDLHVHTPASIINHYGGDNEATWEKYIKELESLPEEFKVIGINDYLFLDGYKKVLEYKESGRLSNIELILPVIELRIDKFGGSGKNLSRINLHVIFSDKIRPDIIENQFINALHNNYQLSPQYGELQWNALLTRESLIELGELIINSVPSEKRRQFSSPLIEGFNNLNFKFDEVLKLLNSLHYFRGKCLTAVGKTEWADIKWNDHTIADKKNIINSVKFVFISAQSPADFYKAKESLTSSRVNDRLLDCSDAHYFSDSTEKDRIGNCFTWIKADPTFEGLKQVINEPEDRVFIGDIPPKISLVRNNKTKYIKSIEIRKNEKSTLEEIWFDNSLEFNHDLVAIIGNKGSGKSALVDIIGLVGNSQRDYYSFLNEDKFCNPKDNKAKHFRAKLIWESEQISAKESLDIKPQVHEVERVKYIPQQFFDKICNEIGTDYDSGFDRELKNVIYSHVPEVDRLGFETLDELIKYKTNEIVKGIEITIGELEDICIKVSELEEQLTEDYKKTISEQLKSKEQELEIHMKNKPKEVACPANDSEKQKLIIRINNRIKFFQDRKEELIKEINKNNEKLDNIVASMALIDKLTQKIENLERIIKTFIKENREDFERIDLELNELLKVEFNKNILLTKRERYLAQKIEIDNLLGTNNIKGLVFKLNKIERIIEKLQAKLDEPNKRYQMYVRELEIWNKRKDEIIGNDDKPGTLKYLQKKTEDMEKVIPEQHSEKMKLLYKKAQEIYEGIQKIGAVYEELYKPVQNFANMKVVKEEFRPSFKVSIEQNGFDSKFLSFINQGIKGSFYGSKEGLKRLDDIIKQYDFNEFGDVNSFIMEVIQNLKFDMRDNKKSKLNVISQFKKGISIADVYKFLFSLEYLKPKFTLKLGNRSLEQLSPGEKGALLLIFYLLVDKDDIPLIIDQPEENLDNQFIYELLVPCIKEAKKRRQVFIVTHNPNLAVVCDAEQVIYASINKSDKYQVNYLSGSIENSIINKKIVDILEGTKPAFRNRESKYIELK